MTRYVEYPAQALSYATGKAQLLKLRDKMCTIMHGDFDLKRFHQEVLRNGAVPLDALTEQVPTVLSVEQSKLSTL